MSAAKTNLRPDPDKVLVQITDYVARYRVKSELLRPLFEEARAQLDEFDEVDLGHVRREHNVDADALVNAALDAVES